MVFVAAARQELALAARARRSVRLEIFYGGGGAGRMAGRAGNTGPPALKACQPAWQSLAGVWSGDFPTFPTFPAPLEQDARARGTTSHGVHCRREAGRAISASALPLACARRSGRELEAEALEAGRDAVGDQADLAQVADQPVVQVAAEVLAEGGLVAAGGALAAELLDLVELGLAEAQLLVD